jgi:hypothetical protein
LGADGLSSVWVFRNKSIEANKPKTFLNNTNKKKNCLVFPRVKIIQGPINGRGKQNAKDQNKLENYAKTVESINFQ